MFALGNVFCGEDGGKKLLSQLTPVLFLGQTAARVLGPPMRSDVPNKYLELNLKGQIGFSLQSNASRNTVNNDTLLKWLLFSAGPHQTGESIIFDLASGEILHSSCKYGQKIHGSGMCIFFLCCTSKCQTFPLPYQ